MPKFKTVDLKADGNGEIAGYFSTWTREPDSYGDVVAKGAFTEAFERIAANGGTVPFLWNHDAGNLDSFIGTAGDFAEDEHGAMFRATFDATPQAQRARELARDGRLCKFSFAYDVLDSGEVTLEDGRKANELRKLDLYEVSLVMYPANDDTGVVDVKSGRRNSAKDEAELRSVAQTLRDCAARLDAITGDNVDEDEGDVPDEAGDGKYGAQPSVKYDELIKAIEKMDRRTA